MLLLAYPKGSVELWINQHIRLDNFFLWVTYLGDGILYVLVSLAMGFKNKRWGLFAVLCFAITGAFSQFLKIVIFPDMPRPSAFFGEDITLHFVKGEKIHTSNSFPSGHTTSAFSLALVLSLYFKKSWVSVVCIMGAILAGFSRVYLMQHFFIDIFFGAWIGVLGTLMLHQAGKFFLDSRQHTN